MASIDFGCKYLLSGCRKSLSLSPRRFKSTASSKTAIGIPPIVDTPLSKPITTCSTNVLELRDSSRNHSGCSQVSRLSNGVLVASDSAPTGEFCTVGLLFNAGSRYEAAHSAGISHLLEKLAYGSSENFDSRESVHDQLELHGAITDCQSTRDTFIYASSCHRSGLASVLSILADSAWRPKFTPDEVRVAKEVVQFDVEDMNRNPNPEPLLTDWIHSAAYRNNTLGLPKYCPVVGRIETSELFSFIQTYFAPNRLVVAGVGVDHTQLVEIAGRFLVGLPANPNNQPSVITDESVAQFTGGQIAIVKDLSSVALGPTPMPELSHFSIGMESSSYRDSDFVPFCVLNSLMGGGGSFSAGGPGKGMYTRLYLNVLNRHHWIYGATAFNHVYSDSGLFCIHASCHPSQLMDLATVITDEVISMSLNIHRDEIARAKTQLKSTLLMNLEQRPVMFEDLGRQVLGHGVRKSPLEYLEAIDLVTPRDIVRVVNRLLSGKVATVGYGNLDKMPPHHLVEKAIQSRNPQAIRVV